MPSKFDSLLKSALRPRERGGLPCAIAKSLLLPLGRCFRQQVRFKGFAFWLALGLVLGAGPAAHGVQVPPLPPNPVVDLAGIVDDAVQSKMDRYLRRLEQKTSAQVAVLTIPTLQGQSIEEFSITVAHDKWKLGQKGKDNGLLLVVALKEHRYRFEVGYGLEGLLPDSLLGSLGRRYLVPYFKKGDYSSGIYAVITIIANKIAAGAGVQIDELPPVSRTAPAVKERGASSPFGKIISLLFFLVLFVVFIRNPRSFLALMLLSSMGGGGGRWGGSGGFGGGGFGGFGGGGGGFGGGGASGGW